MPTIVRSPATKPVLTVLAEALAWAQLHQHPVRLADLTGHGVKCVSGEAREIWLRDRSQWGVTPIGAAILQHQPDCTLLEEAAAIALGVGIPEAEGIADALARAQKSLTWQRTPFVRHAYDRGYEIGSLLYMAIKSRTCAKHGRYPLSENVCPICMEQKAADLDRADARGDA